jgi:hypothetical protein
MVEELEQCSDTALGQLVSNGAEYLARAHTAIQQFLESGTTIMPEQEARIGFQTSWRNFATHQWPWFAPRALAMSSSEYNQFLGLRIHLGPPALVGRDWFRRLTATGTP